MGVRVVDRKVYLLLGAQLDGIIAHSLWCKPE